jgi:CheY-like chemotaxis protein
LKAVSASLNGELNMEDQISYQKAQREDKLRHEEVLATLAHEIRNPLAAISNVLEMWSIMEHDPEQMARLREIAHHQLEQMTRLSDDLLDIGRIAQGKLKLRLENISARSLIGKVLEQIRPLIDQRGHVLTVSLPDEPLIVHGDASRLTQALANLVQNAAKYTEPGGSIWVTAELSNETAVIRVRDNGRGIPEEMLSAIFNLFTQVDAPLEHALEGLGIGLTLVKRIVEMHGGSISVRSEGLECGSEFIVRLPALSAIAPSEQCEVPRPLKGIAQNAPRRILVVDDVRALAQTQAMMLRHIGHDVQMATDGAEALRIIFAERPDVVFLDVFMPDMDGIEVAREIRKHAELDAMVLIALTGHAEERWQRRALAAGFNHLLVKPTSIAAMEQVLRSADNL